MEVLQHHADAAAQVAAEYLVDVDVVEKDAPVLEVVEARQQPDQGALAGAGGADDGQRFSPAAIWRFRSLSTGTSAS